MFGLGFGKQAYPTVYTVTPAKKSSKKASPSTALPKQQTPPTDSLQPAIDGPPSPERIRAYTEQMKRSSIFGNNSRSNTFSSATSSFRSRESTTVSTDSLTLSRKSSGRSNASSMPSSRSDRPESVHIFGRTLFSRRGRRVKADTDTSSSSPVSGSVKEEISEEGSARSHYYGQGSRSRSGTMTSSNSPPPSQEQRTKHLISGPYNFQHVTHTQSNHLPDLQQSTHTELVSEFTALRASQSPTKGELKGIRAEDLHFEDFSSEALGASLLDEDAGRPHSRGRRQRSVLRKSVVPPQPQRPVAYAKSHDNFNAPPRPPRSPLSPICPVALPARTSSRTASILFDTFDPLATTTLERPQTNGGFRRPAPFGPPAHLPPPLKWNEQARYVTDGSGSHAITTQDDESWPLPSPSLTLGAELADVQEEEEEAVKRRSKMSTASGELRMSQSVPSLRLRSYSGSNMPETPTTLTTLICGSPPKQSLSPGFHLSQDSWDNAIDYAYEHEAEADCDYQWDRCSVDDDNATIGESQTLVETPVLDLHLGDDDRSVYHGRFRPSLLVPSACDIPELSPMSNASTSSCEPPTPSTFLRPGHGRSPSHASSFKESHGFTLSPTLLIPSDFKSQMDQDAVYDEHFQDQTVAASIFQHEPYHHSISPVDDSTSSTASYRSSNFSRGSARSSSSTRISGTNSRGSQDSMLLLSRAASISQAHRSIGSASSLPDLVPSTYYKLDHAHDADLSQSVGALNLEGEDDDSAPGPEILGPAPVLGSLQHRRNKSLVLEQGLRKGVNHFAPPPMSAEVDHAHLSPVAESFVDSPTTTGPIHSRKGSVPSLNPAVKEFKGRARSATASSGGSMGKKSRGSYMLFPQI